MKFILFINIITAVTLVVSILLIVLFEILKKNPTQSSIVYEAHHGVTPELVAQAELAIIASVCAIWLIVQFIL